MIVGVIPARGGSKGIHRKNLAQICGKPLIYWTIYSALRSKLLDEIYVSTEDDEIAQYSHSQGVKVLHRPRNLAQDMTTTIDVLNYHSQKDLGLDSTICTLQPTSPIRLAGRIDDCINLYRESSPALMATGYECKIQPFGDNNNLPRQKIEGFFYDDGNVYIHSPGALRAKKWSDPNALKFYTKEVENYEIDTETDLKVVEFLLGGLRDKNAI